MAQKAAEASECADDQGKFWEYHDIIFENQESLSLASLKQWAATLELDTTTFNNCLDSGKQAGEVANDLSDASAAGGRGTPYFIVGNQPLSGAQPFAAFQQAIESQLYEGLIPSLFFILGRRDKMKRCFILLILVFIIGCSSNSDIVNAESGVVSKLSAP